MAWDTVWMGLAGSAAAGAATGLGALPVLLVRDFSQRLQDTLLGFAAGVMLAASFFSLIVPGLDAARSLGHGGSAAAAIVVVAVLLGGLVLGLINRYAPHEHFISGPNGQGATARVRRIWLFVIAITLHNAPEGLAVGVAYGGGPQEGHALALAIGLQNVPEGLAVATALASLGYRRLVAAGLALGTGLVEPLGGLLGAGVVAVAQPLLPWGLGFAAGAMLFVISNEIIPETHRKGHESLATSGLMVGLAVMMFLDVSLG